MSIDMCAKSGYVLKDIKEYIECINSVIANVMENKYSFEYGLTCAVSVFRNFSRMINKMDIDLNNKENMQDTLEVYMSVDYLYRQYMDNCENIDAAFLVSLNFPFISKGTKIVSLIYMKTFKEWGCTYRIVKESNLQIGFHKDLYELFKDISSKC